MFKNWSNNGSFKSATLEVLSWNTDSSLTSSQFFISCQVHICYTTKKPSSSTMENKQHLGAPYNLTSPCTHFLSCHQPKSLFKLSSFISNINIPFSKTRLEYFNNSCNDSEPIHIRSHADFVCCVFRDISSIASDVVTAESNLHSKLAVDMCLTLNRTVVLTEDDFDMLQELDNKDWEGGEVTNFASKLMDYRTRDDFSIPALLDFYFSVKGIALTKDVIDVFNERLLEKRLLKKVLALDHECEELCSVCHEELRDDGEAIVATPCLHLFHQECVVKWMKTHNACPMCRFRFFVSLTRCYCPSSLMASELCFFL